ncbi:MAG: nucleotidyltransferase domain-containing protein [Betaproteobacteria bacterium]
MSTTNRLSEGALPTRLFRGPKIPRSAIRHYARQVAERFQLDKIILFGSHADGQPQADSDVDILVIMPARNQHDQAVRIRWELPAPFPVDLLVRTPQTMQWRLDEGDSFLAEIMTKGKVLYEKAHERVGADSSPITSRHRVLTTETRRVALGQINAGEINAVTTHCLRTLPSIGLVVGCGGGGWMPGPAAGDAGV